MATRLADRGLLEKSLSYLEQVSTAILKNPTIVQASLVDKIYELADKLKYCDPVGDVDDSNIGDGEMEKSRIEASWLNDLRTLQNDFNV